MTRSFQMLILFVALVVAACGSGTSATDGASDDSGGSSADAVSIVGVWQMVEFDGEQVDVSVNTANIPELEFTEDGVVEGNFGCNNGGGDYEHTGTSLLFSEIGAEEAGCPRPDGQEGLVPTETLLLEIFNSGEPVAIDANEDAMSWSQGEISLTFQAIDQ